MNKWKLVNKWIKKNREKIEEKKSEMSEDRNSDGFSPAFNADHLSYILDNIIFLPDGQNPLLKNPHLFLTFNKFLQLLFQPVIPITQTPNILVLLGQLLLRSAKFLLNVNNFLLVVFLEAYLGALFGVLQAGFLLVVGDLCVEGALLLVLRVEAEFFS